MQGHHQSTNIDPKEGHLVQGAPRRLTITRDPGLSCLDLWPAKLFLLSAKELLGPLPFRQHLQKLLNCLDLWSRKDLKVSLFHWWFWLGETFVSWIFEEWWGERVWEVQVSLREVPVMLSTCPSQLAKCHADKYLNTPPALCLRDKYLNAPSSLTLMQVHIFGEFYSSFRWM